MTEQPINPDWITTKQAARLLNLTTRRVQQLVAAKELVGHKVARNFVLVSRESVEEFDRNRL